MTPHRHLQGVGSNWWRAGADDPCRCTAQAGSSWNHRLHLGHATAEGRRSARVEGRAGRASSCAWREDQERVGCVASAWGGVGVGGRRFDTGATRRVGGGWVRVLGGVLGGGSSSFERASRWAVGGEVVSELREDCGVGGVAWGRCRASLVHVAEWSDCDASGGEADRADGRPEHDLDVVVGVHSFGSGAVGFGGDKGCE